MLKFMTLCMLTILTLTACQSEETGETDQTSEFYNPLSYESDEGIERSGRIPTGKDSYFKRTTEREFRDVKYSETDRSHDNDFNNEDAMAVVEKVHELKEVTVAQAFSTDNHMYVAVMINPYDRRDQDVMETIEKKAGEVTEKKITVYTNNNTWDHKKDLNARLKASQAPDQLKIKIQNFFNKHD